MKDPGRLLFEYQLYAGGKVVDVCRRAHLVVHHPYALAFFQGSSDPGNDIGSGRIPGDAV
jgi:hypothetical protein